MSAPVSVALASFGMSGKVFHGPLIAAHPHFRLFGAWQRSKRDFLDAYPTATLYRRFEDLLAEDEIELVVVNTPEHSHFDYAKRALLAGKHVVVEKAFTVTTEEASQLIELAREHKRILSVFHNRRWDNDFLTVKEVISRGLLGRLVTYEARYDRYRTFIRESWKEQALPGTGIVYNLGSHLIDQTVDLFGMPQWVWADMRIQRSGGSVPDHMEIIMGYSDMKARLTAGYLVADPPPKYQVFGEKGTFRKPGSDPQEAALAAGLIPGSTQWGTEAPGKAGILTRNTAKGLVRESYPSRRGTYLHFYDELFHAIRSGSDSYIDGKAGKKVIEIIQLAVKSANSGKIESGR